MKWDALEYFSRKQPAVERGNNRATSKGSRWATKLRQMA